MCGIFGIHGHKEAANLTYLGLYALQHRGEESCGIVTYRKNKVSYHKGMGLVSDVFKKKDLKPLKGDFAVGHVRYSTTGSSTPKNIQPFLIDHKKGNIAIAHNGNLTNASSLRHKMEEKGSIFQTTMDSEIIAHLLVKPEKDSLEDNVVSALSELEGAYSLAVMFNNTLIAARDPKGFRPLCLGKLNECYVIASETCALDLIHAEYIRDVEPGEIIFINESGLRSIKPFDKQKPSFCIFEYIYFARPDSNIFGKNVYATRKRLGENLACEYPAKKCDFVMAIPDSGSYAAVGFAQKSKMPHEIGMIRNHYVGRTFIQPSQLIRDFRVRIKLNPIKDVIKNKAIAVVEDSIVRGTTSRARIKTLREVGAKQIHMRVSCPALKFPCFYGIDFPTKKELIASKHSVSWIRDFIGVESLDYLSLEGMLKAMLLPKENFCTACFNGSYPTNIIKKPKKNAFEKKQKKK